MGREFDESANRAAAYFTEAREFVQKGDPRAAAAAYRSGKDAMDSAAGLKESVGDEIRYLGLSSQNFLAGNEVINSLAGRISRASKTAADRVSGYKASFDIIAGKPVSSDASASDAIEQRGKSLTEADEYAGRTLAGIRDVIADAIEDVRLATEISVIFYGEIPRTGLAGELYNNIDGAGRELELLSRRVNQMRSLIEGRDADQ
ncbi:MAG: hypothetical protein HY516_02420 [Candidatus Aenigmarchaeota archaeon]|nr:hypothetical protein [Candidatus Aenigmarchaeota archaeon]